MTKHIERQGIGNSAKPTNPCRRYNMNQSGGKVTGKIHSIETCGTVDGPGIRYIIFTQGCPLRCLYCHNPDTWQADSPLSKEKSVSELLKDIIKYKSYFKASGGGVTVTGGEPLMQKEFVTSLFKTLKENEFHTCIDTSGHTNIDQATKDLLSYTDLVLLDIKSINPNTFNKTTGVNIDRTLNFNQYLCDNNIDTWVRFVLVPGLTDDLEDIHKLAKYTSNFSNIKKVGVLPFHQMGMHKWNQLGMKYQLENTPTPTNEETERVRDIFKSYGHIVT